MTGSSSWNRVSAVSMDQDENKENSMSYFKWTEISKENTSIERSARMINLWCHCCRRDQILQHNVLDDVMCGFWDDHLTVCRFDVCRSSHLKFFRLVGIQNLQTYLDFFSATSATGIILIFVTCIFKSWIALTLSQYRSFKALNKR